MYVPVAKRPMQVVTIEYEDENYTYISSAYKWKKLKKDVETIKKKITITML